ncbi:hypothetical protein Tco_1426515, partial [Tanacetum coccineum]
MNVHECEKCLKFETRLLNRNDFIKKETYDKLFRSFTTLEKYCISLEVHTQLNQEIFQRDNSVSNQSAPNFDQYFELNELKAQSQEKDTVIKKWKERIKSLIGNMNEDKTYKQLYDSITPTRIRSKEQCDALVSQVNQKFVEISDLNHPKLNWNSELLCVKCNCCILSDNHDLCVLDFINDVNACVKSKSVKKSSKRKVWKPTGKVFTNIRYTWRPTGRTFTIVGNAFPLTRITTTAEVPLRKPTAPESDTPKHVVTLVYLRKPMRSKTNVPVSKTKIIKSISANKKEPIKFGNDHVAKILCYGDYHIGNVTISRVYYVEGLGHNLFSVGQFCDLNLEVAFRQHTCVIRNLEGVDLLTGSRGNNLYTLSLGDMMASSPICLLSKASKT